MAINDYFLALALTLVIEVGVAVLFGYGNYVALKTVVLVNLMSHPLLTYLLLFNAGMGFLDFETAVIILEILVVVLEWQLLLLVLRNNAKRLFALSATMNLASFLTGLIVFPI